MQETLKPEPENSAKRAGAELSAKIARGIADACKHFREPMPLGSPVSPQRGGAMGEERPDQVRIPLAPTATWPSERSTDPCPKDVYVAKSSCPTHPQNGLL